MAAIITATRTSTLFTDQDGDSQFDPGDTILTRIRISNTGDAPAGNITVEDTLSGVTMVVGSVQITPIAHDDNFSITGNTPITLTAAQIRGNDDDPDGAEANLKITEINGTSVVDGLGAPISVTIAVTNGSVTSNLDGSFTFTPTTGLDVNATASFTYTVLDEQGLESVDLTPGKVTFTITDVAWYVDNTYGGGGSDGSYLKPFTSLTPLNNNGADVDSAGETIFLFHNGGNYTSGIILEAGQKLIGDGQAFMANNLDIGGTSRTSGTDSVSTNAVISQASGTLLTLSTDNTVKGVDLNASGAGAIGMADGGGSVTSAAVGAKLLVSGVNITGVGQAVDIDAGGHLEVTITSLTSSGSSGGGVQLAGTAASGPGLISGSFTVSGGDISGATSHAFQIGGNGPSSGGTVTVNYIGTIGATVTGSTGGSAVNIADRIATPGDIDFTGNITQNAAPGSAAIALSNIAAGDIDFTGNQTITITGGTQNAISVTSQSGGTIDFTGGAVDIDFSTGTSGDAFSFVGQTGGAVAVGNATDVDFAGTASGDGVSIVNAGTAAGSVGFTGGLTITTQSGDGINVNNNTQGTGALNIATGVTNSIGTATGQIISVTNGTTTGMTFASLTSSGVTVGNAIDINNLDGGTFTTGATTIANTNSGSDAINIRGGSSTNFVFNGNTDINGTGLGGDGVELNATSGTVSFNNLTIDGVTGAGAGLSIQSATNSVTVSNGAIANGLNTGDAVNITGGTGAVTVAASLSKNTAGNVVEVSNHATGNVTFSGTISGTGNLDNGILLSGNSSGTIGFTNASKILTTGVNNAVTISSNGANVDFTGGGLVINTSSGSGITAGTTSVSTGGTLTVSGTGNTITSTTGSALVLNGTDSDGLTFQSIAKNGGSATGIFLNNAGTGGLTVTGTGTTAGTGGTIQSITGTNSDNTTGIGLYVANTDNISLSNMNFSGTIQNYAIKGNNVTNFTLRDSNLSGSLGNDDGAENESAILFTDLDGVGLFEGNNISGGYYDNLRILTTSGTLHLFVRDTAAHAAIFGHNSATVFANDSISVEMRNNSNLFAVIDGVQFTGWRGDGVAIQTIDTANSEITIKNSSFVNSHPNIASAGGIGVLIDGTGNGASWSVDYTIQDNTFSGSKGYALAASFVGTSGKIRGYIEGNLIGTNNGTLQTSGSTTGSSEAGGMFLSIEKQQGSAGVLEHYVTVDNNIIRDVAKYGIYVRSTNGGAAPANYALTEATIKNNNIDEMFGPGVAALRALAGGNDVPSGESGRVGLDLQNNVFNADTSSDSYGAIFLDQIYQTTSLFYLPGYPGNDFAGESYGVGNASVDLTNYFVGRGNTLTPSTTANVAPFSAGVYAADAKLAAINLQPAPTGSDTQLPSGAIVLAQPVFIPDPEPGPDPLAEPDQTPGQGGETQKLDGDPAAPPAPPAPPAPSSPTAPADDGVLTQAELAALVEAAIQRWIDAGANSTQVAAMRAVDVRLVDMSGIYVGAARQGSISIDGDGGGYGWFVDTTPGEDSEFGGSGTSLTADKGGAADGKVDLLTVLMHELGHQIGLDDDYNTNGATDLMYGYVHVGERRLPADGDAEGAVPGVVHNESFAVIPATITSLPANKMVDVYFKSTIDLQEDKYISPLMNTATIKVGGVTVTTANENNALDSLTLGDVVYLDANKNGQFDAGEGVANVSVSLYVDTNNSGGWDAGDVKLGASQLTLAGGLYSFVGLAPGDYIVVVDAANFNSGQPLFGRVSYTGGGDPDNNVDNNDDGIAGVAGLGAGIASQTITLSYNNEGPSFTPGTPLGVAGHDTNNTLDFGFITPNAAPVLSNVDGNIASFIEGGAAVLLDVLGDAALSDAQANFNNGTLTVHVGTGAVAAEDVLSASSGAVSLSGGTVTVGGQNIGTYTGGSAGADLVFTFNTLATPARVQDLVRALNYSNSNNVNPSTDTRSIAITLVDGGGTDGGLGADTTVVNVLVNVTGVNDAPDGGAGNADTTNDLTTLTFTASDFSTGFTDPDGNIFDGIVITSLPSVGTLKLNNVNVVAPQTVTLADLTGGLLTYVPTAGTGGQNPTFGYKVKDNGGVLNGGVDTDPTASTFTIAVTAANAAPVVDLDANDSVTVGTGFASAYTEGAAAAAISDTDVDITDADSGDDIVSATITITNPETGDKLVVGTLPGTVTKDGTSTDTVVKLVAAPGTSAADFEAAIKAITFENTGDDPTDKGTNLSRSITVVVNDGTSNSAAATATVAVTDVNDLPTGTNATITAIEDTFRLLTAADFGFVDADGVLGSVTISAVSGGAIYLDSDGTAGGGGFFIETLPKTYSAQDLLDGKVAFAANPHSNGLAKGTITFTVADDDVASAPGSNVLTVDVTAVNDQPNIPNSGTINATEQVAIRINSTLTVTDIDLDALNGGNGDYSGASFAINRDVSNAEDVFTLNTTGALFTVNGNNLESGGNVFATFSQSGGILNLNFVNNGTVPSSALVNDVLQHLEYTNTSNTPPASVTLLYVINDGAPGNGQGTVTASNNIDGGQVVINIAAVNDAPVNSLGATLSTIEDVIDAWLNDMSVLDVDAGSGDIDVTFEVQHGTLTIKTNVTNGIVAGDIIFQDANTITVRASQAKINLTLAEANGLTYTPDQHYNGTDTLTVTTNDRGLTGTDPGLSGDGSSEQDVDTRTITISAVDDAPVAVADSVSTPEDTVGTTGNLLANDSDVDGPAVTISGVTGGTLGVPFALPSGAILQVNSDGTYSYNPNGKFNTLTNPSGGEVGAVNTSATDSFQYTVSGGNTVTVTVTITGVANQFDWLAGDATNNTISGTPNGDFFYAVLGGNDDLSGLGGNDVFLFDGGMTSADKINGGAGIDQIALQGNYSGGLTFGADVLDIENLVLLPGNDTRFGDTAGNLYDYNITLLDVNVASGVKMVIDANRLRIGEDFTFNGSAESDGTFFIYGGGGTDNLTGGAKNDVFLFGAQGQWGSSDVLVGGGGIDQLALRGDYTVVFGAGQLSGIEQIAMVSAFDTRFGALGDTYDYNLTMNDGNVVGIQMTIDAAPLRSIETLTFDGSAEDDGSFRVFGGAGADVIKGSQNSDILVGRENADMLTGNGGNDFFRYNSTGESTASARDKILDFSVGDLVDLSRIDADINTAGDQAFNFIGTAGFGNVAGQLRYQSHGGTEWLVQGDTDGNGIADFELILNIPVVDPITSGDFIL